MADHRHQTHEKRPLLSSAGDEDEEDGESGLVSPTASRVIEGVDYSAIEGELEDGADKRKGGAATSAAFPLWKQAALSAYWFGWSFMWLPLFTIIIPLQVS